VDNVLLEFVLAVALKEEPASAVQVHARPFVGVFKVLFKEMLSTFGNKCPQNGSKNEPRAPRTCMGCPHEGPQVVVGLWVKGGRERKREGQRERGRERERDRDNRSREKARGPERAREIEREIETTGYESLREVALQEGARFGSAGGDPTP